MLAVPSKYLKSRLGTRTVLTFGSRQGARDQTLGSGPKGRAPTLSRRTLTESLLSHCEPLWGLRGLGRLEAWPDISLQPQCFLPPVASLGSALPATPSSATIPSVITDSWSPSDESTSQEGWVILAWGSLSPDTGTPSTTVNQSPGTGFRKGYLQRSLAQSRSLGLKVPPLQSLRPGSLSHWEIWG